MKQKKKKCLILALLFCLIITTMSGCGFGFLTEDEWFSEEAEEEANGLLNLILETGDLDTELVQHGIEPDQNGTYLIHNIATVMYYSLFGEYEYQDCLPHLWVTKDMQLQPAKLVTQLNDLTVDAINSDSVFSNLLSAIQGLACSILIVIWAMGFISQIVEERFTMEAALKGFMQLICGLLIVLNAQYIVSAFASAGNILMNSLSGESSITLAFSNFQDTIMGYLTDGISVFFLMIQIFTLHLGFGFWIDWGSFVAMLFLAFPFITLLMCDIQIASQMFMRMMELLIRITMAPIPLAFGAQRGFSQESIHYFRQVFACAFQPVLILAGCLCFDTIGNVVGTLFGTSGSLMGMISIAVCYILLSSYVGQTRNLSMEIVGRG